MIAHDDHASSPGLSSDKLPMFVAFWLATYGLLSLYNGLQPYQPLDLISIKRFITISLGTVAIWWLMTLVDRLSRRSLAVRALAVAAVSLSTALVIFAARYAFNELIGIRSATTEEAAPVLVWLGYFLAGVGAYSTLRAYAEIERLRRERRSAPATAERPVPPPEDEPVLWVHRNQRMVPVPIASVERIQACGNYVEIHAAGTSGLVRASLSSLADSLDPGRFVRVHRSVICRRDDIRSLQRKPSGAMAAMLSGGVEVPVGRNFAKLVSEIVGESDSVASPRSVTPVTLM